MEIDTINKSDIYDTFKDLYLNEKNRKTTYFKVLMKPTLTRWGRLSKRFQPSESTGKARRSNAATFNKVKQIFFMPIPRTWFKVEEFRLE